MLALEDRQRIATLPLKERRAALKGRTCEVCGLKPARNVLPHSHLLCCTVRADRCPNSTPLEGSTCWGCGAPARGKTKSGWVCTPESATGCPEITRRQHEEKAKTQAAHQQDPTLKEQRRARYVQTLQERYGVTGMMANPESLAKYEATCTERFGVPNAAQADDIKERVRQANRKVYGVDYPSQLTERRDNLKKKCIERFGVPSCVSSTEWRASYKERTGEDHPSKLTEHRKTLKRVQNSPEVRAKVVATHMSRYGAAHPCSNPEVFRTSYLPRFYRNKEFTLPSGRMIHYQGYELGAIREALATWGEADLLFNGELSFSYADPTTGRQRTYYPDLAVVSSRRVIEVKSLYTLQHGLKSDLVPKLLTAIENGWEPVVELRGPKLSLIETYSIDDILDLQAELGRASA